MGWNCCPQQGQPNSIGAHAAVHAPLKVRSQDTPQFSTARTRIWELSDTLHYSIIGTCMTTAELRKVLTKLGLARPEESDHELHSRGVGLAGQNGPGGRLINKALDTCHTLAIRQFARAESEAALRALWQDAARRGDIPGPYWALLSHPAGSYALLREAFGHVHMLSHLVGSANRADIRRLTELETLRVTLEDKIARQQTQLRDSIGARDRTIAGLQAALSERVTQDSSGPASQTETEQALQQTIGALSRKCASEARRRVACEARLDTLTTQSAQDRAARIAAETREAVLRAELAAAEVALHGPSELETALPRLDGLTLAYIGGRPHQVAHLRALGNRMGAALLHHDGGVEEQGALLAGMVGRADLVLFPVDCISHEATLELKRLCRRLGRSYLPLRSAGQGTFLAALAAWDMRSRQDQAAD